MWTCQDIYAVPFVGTRTHPHDRCSQSHTLELLIVRSFAVSL